MAMTTVGLRELGDEQAAIAGTSAMLAARRRSEANLARLADLVAQLENAADSAVSSRADARFHIEVAVSSQSERLTRRQVLLQGEYVDLLWLADAEPDYERCVRQHVAIADAIRHERPDEARARAEEHALDDARRLIDLHLRMDK